MRRLGLVILVMLAMTGCSKRDVKQHVAKVGGAAPDFTLSDLSGRPVHLADLRGKVVLVNFWATWCPPCRAEIPSMQKLNDIMAGKPFQMLAISIDEGGKEAIAAFFRQNGGTLPVLLDTTQQVSKLYGTTGVPETFVVDKKGIILDKIVGGLEWNDPKVVEALTEIMNR